MISPQYRLKWMDAKHASAVGLDLKFINTQVLAFTGKDGLVAGWTAFEPRDLNRQFLEKVQFRLAAFEGAYSLCLYAPPTLTARFTAFFNHHPVPDLQFKYTPFLHIQHTAGGFVFRDTMKIVNVDDSPVLLKFLKQAFDTSGYARIVAQESDSTKAVAAIRNARPDLVTMDIQMPVKTGVDVVRDLLELEHYPILMISSLSMDEGSLVFEALNSGAFDYIQKPKLEERAAFQAELLEKTLAAVKGVPIKRVRSVKRIENSGTYDKDLIWCLGSSTGGTQALTSIFTSMPTHIPPTLVVQHIPPVFSKSFSNCLNDLCPFTVKEAEHGDELLPDHVYIARGGMQMGVEKVNGKVKIVLSDAAPVNRFKPSVDYLMHNVARELSHLKIVAGILTGMGKDGAEGLLALKKAGARTFAQDESTSVVYGMPRAAFELGGADEQQKLENIAAAMLRMSQNWERAKTG